MDEKKDFFMIYVLISLLNYELRIMNYEFVLQIL